MTGGRTCSLPMMGSLRTSTRTCTMENFKRPVRWPEWRTPPRGQAMAAMCISLGDYDNDGWLDLYISDFQKSSDHLWHNSG